MATTTVHIADETLRRIDAIAARRGVSRNRVVVDALNSAIEHDRGSWGADFFELPSPDHLAEIVEAVAELEADIVRARRNRGAVLL